MCAQYWAPSDEEKKIFRKYAYSVAKDEVVMMTLPTPVVAMGNMGGKELTSKACKTFRPGGWYLDDVMNSYGDLVKVCVDDRRLHKLLNHLLLWIEQHIQLISFHDMP